MADLLAVGIVRGAHGVKGELRVKSFSGSLEHLERLKEAVARKGRVERRLLIRAARRRPPDILLKVAGVDTRDDAVLLAGYELWAERESAARLGAGEYYESDLCRCRLFFGEEDIGRVRGVLDTGAAAVLEISRPGGGSVLVPFVDHFIGEVDVAAGRIILREDYIVR